VPAAHESVYLEILNRLNERAVTMAEDKIDIILADSIGHFSCTTPREINQNSLTP
jgi:hypothetical protein